MEREAVREDLRSGVVPLWEILFFWEDEVVNAMLLRDEEPAWLVVIFTRYYQSKFLSLAFNFIPTYIIYRMNSLI